MSAMRTHFTYRVDTWTPDGESIVEHVAGRRGLPGRTRYLPRRLRTLARRSHHLAAGRRSDREQQASTRGVGLSAPRRALGNRFSGPPRICDKMRNRPAHLQVLSVGVSVSVINGFGSTARMVRGPDSACKQCGGRMDKLADISPQGREPGLRAFVCSECEPVGSVLVLNRIWKTLNSALCPTAKTVAGIGKS